MTAPDDMLNLAEWLCHEQARFASSICSNDPAVKSHIATLKTWEEAVRASAQRPTGGEVAGYSFGMDYGKDILVDLNKLAHTAGTDAIRRDCFQRAYREISRLRASPPSETGHGQSEVRSEDAWQTAIDLTEKSILSEYYSGRLNGDQRIKEGFKNLRAILSTRSAEPKRVTGCISQFEEGACLIWNELCPGMVMGDADLPHYEAAAKAVLALANRPAGATEREVVAELAAMLLARDETGGYETIPDSLIDWGRNYIAAGRDAVHSGDCTNESHSCIRCGTDGVLLQARQILASLPASSRSASGAEGSKP